MGGRYDPTNVLSAEISIITNVDYDHTKSLGDTIPEIAFHKAGIIKEGQRVVTAATKPETLAAIDAEVAAKNATLQHVNLADDLTITARYGNYTLKNLSLKSHYQRINAATAITAVDWLAHDFGFDLTKEAIASAFSNLESPGRFEVVQDDPTIILDGAHNPHKMAALVDSVKRAYPDRSIWVLAGMIVGKSAEPILQSLLPIASRLILSQPKVIGKPPQSLDALDALVESYAPWLPTAHAPNVQDGIDYFLHYAEPGDMLLITGSIYLIGEARERWYDSAEKLKELEKRRDA